ncbi:uncharacterized protein LOC117779621 [Drosophila innubila]|uniref:uncharacterized protein LOC117779621 n=1 Tax=Drosophila innubila TaxID=198719 RepID=UPI00148CF451|nr:uncharacterized protein LOC117779621 [Drosophila innubila]XP_034471773.1 uncharacterized protein LOC117779621 [Drosophila innubila]
MRSMFRPIKKIFTYIQKNASNGKMFGSTNSINTDDDDVASGSNAIKLVPKEEEQQLEREQEHKLEVELELEHEDDDIERQIKTSIIDATKVHATKSKIILPLQLQLDDELADFAHEPATLADEEADNDIDNDNDHDDDVVELDEQYLELENYPNNEIIVLTENELNSSLASDNISEDPLAIDEFTQPTEQDNEEEEIENNGELLWLKLDTPMQAVAGTGAATTTNSGNVDDIVITAPSVTASSAKVPAKTKEEELLRSDGGSDSGLGGENDRHNATTTATTTEAAPGEATTTLQKPLRSNLKRRLEDDELSLVPDMNSSSTSSTSTATSVCLSSAQKRAKRSINFDSVKVYYFPRQQGFNCVPTAGGCTLGMGARHIAFKTMTLAEHAAELRRAHRSQNQSQEQQQQLRIGGSSSDDSEESEEDYLSEGSGSDADDGSNGFLQPVTPKQRRALLKAAGVRKIDASEKIDCRDIRNSREVCGCSCREFCDPETCACSQAGIKCQVDRAMFPCGCTREACGNTVGRVEFNPTRVRTHYIHTVMRLDMEQRQSQGPPAASGNNSLIYSNSSVGVISTGAAAATSASSSSATSSHCYFMQPQSNYSSGYASPAYTPEPSVSYYQQQQQQQQQTLQATVSPLSTSYPQLDSLDSGLFASGSNATPSYGELLTPTYHQTLGYGSAQLNSYTGYQQTTSTSGGSASPEAYSSCAVPSVPPFGNATTTASNATQYQHANALETTASSMNVNSSSGSSSISVTASSCSAGLVRLSGAVAADFISLNTPIGSSSRLSQINDLLQHNRNATSALVAVSESYTSVRNSSSNINSTIDSIDTPPIIEEAQRSSCMTFEELPPPLINPTPIVAVVEHSERKLQLQQVVNSTPQPRQPLDTSGKHTESLASDI